MDVFCIATIQLEGISPPPRFDYDTVVVDGKPDFTIASLGNAGNTRGKRIVVQAAKTWNLPIIIGGTGVSVVKCYSVWVESQPEPCSIGGEYGIHVVDGRGILQIAQLPLSEERWGGGNLQDSVILRAEPDVSRSICADVIAVDESVVAYLCIFLPVSLRLFFVEIADAFSRACPECIRSRVFYEFIEDIEIIGSIGILMILRILQIARIADAQHSVPPGSYPEAMVSVEKE